MASKLFSILFLAISSLAFVGFAEQSDGGGGDGSDSGGGSMLPCVQKLLPCQPALMSHSTAPPSTCCIPLKQIIQDDPKCLCDVFNNPVLLKGLNITQDDALTLAKNCHANADTSVCKTVAGNPPVSTPSPPATSNSSSSSNSTAKASKSAAVRVVAGFGEPLAISSVLFPLLSVVGLI